MGNWINQHKNILELILHELRDLRQKGRIDDFASKMVIQLVCANAKIITENEKLKEEAVDLTARLLHLEGRLKRFQIDNRDEENACETEATIAALRELVDELVIEGQTCSCHMSHPLAHSGQARAIIFQDAYLRRYIPF